MTPAKMRSNGRSAPCLIRTGRRKLSSVPTNIIQTSSNDPHTLSPVQYIQTVAGRRTSVGPS